MEGIQKWFAYKRDKIQNECETDFKMTNQCFIKKLNAIVSFFYNKKLRQ